MNNTIVQIYGIKSVSDAKMVAGLGANHLGVAYGSPRFIGFETAKEIFDSIGDQAVKVGLTVAFDMEEIVTMVTTVMPDVLHLSGDIAKFTPAQVAELKNRVKELKIMQALPANDPKVFDYVKAYETVSDFFLIDTVVERAGDIGATGLTHDLQIDKKIVEMTSVPCIIAGGLGADNVAEAIRIVRPYGVDSLTKTNLESPSGDNLKDPLKVKAFVEAVRNTI